MKYKPQFYDLLKRVGIQPSALTPKLQNLIEKFEKTVEAVPNHKKDQLLPVLVQVDAVISGSIAKAFNIQLKKENSNAQSEKKILDKAKAMVMKARELQRKWKTNKA